MEYLDTYDEEKNFLGKQPRDYVHTNALWHNTVHCWLYDNAGNVYFQIRADEKTFYTTASGHVLAGETIKQAFGREIQEEIGININYNDAHHVSTVKYKMDKVKSDGSVFRDRAFANVYLYNYNDSEPFNFDPAELDGLVKVNAKDTLTIFEEGHGEVPAEIITSENGKNVSTFRNVSFNEFLVNAHETAIEKYGDILKEVIKLTK